jgi:hypothetical protein
MKPHDFETGVAVSKRATRPRDEFQMPSLFDTSRPDSGSVRAPESAGVPSGGRVDREPHPAHHADRAAQTDDGEQLLATAARAANAILDATGYMTVAQVRKALGDHGKLANDGTEKLDALGALGRRMGLVAVGTERAPKDLAKSHGNRHTVWMRPADAARARSKHEGAA